GRGRNQRPAPRPVHVAFRGWKSSDHAVAGRRRHPHDAKVSRPHGLDLPAAGEPICRRARCREPAATRLQGVEMIHLTVTGMHCEGCVSTVERVVKREDTGARVAVDLASGAVDIESAKPAAAFVAAIEGAGYDAAVGAP